MREPANVVERALDLLASAGAAPKLTWPEQPAPSRRCIHMMASRSATSAAPLAERPTPARSLVAAEPAFRGALTESLEGLALCDRNMLRFYYFHGLTVDQLADMFCSRRAVVVRRLARIRERLLRDTRRGLAARLPLDKHALDRLVDLARSRFDLALTRVLRG